jgi:hypothetical protein
MNHLIPNLDMLEAYALGELSPGEESDVQQWLIVRGDEEILEAYEAVAARLEIRRKRLELWGNRPTRARLDRAIWRLRSRATRDFASLLDAVDEGRLLSFAALGRRADDASGDQTVAVPLGQTIDLIVDVRSTGRIAVLAVLPDERLVVLCKDDGLLSVGTRIEIPGFLVENPEEMLWMYVLYSASAPIPTPAPSDDVAWLAAQLDQLRERGDGGCLRRLFIAAPT